MSRQRSSPYLMLGVPFGANRDEVAKGFARAVRRLRRHDNPPFAPEDLNWAQHEIDHREGVAEHSLDDFRVPADPGAYELPHSQSVDIPKVVPFERRTSSTDPTEVDRLRREAVVYAALDVVEAVITTPPSVNLPSSFIMREDPTHGA